MTAHTKDRSASPTYVREVQAATRDYEKDGNLRTFNLLLKTSLDSALAEAYRSEQTMRVLATLWLSPVSACGVWTTEDDCPFCSERLEPA